MRVEGRTVHPCPNGCSVLEIEVGTEGTSFLAIMGKPYRYLRCGQCKFGEDNKTHVRSTMGEAIDVWNAACQMRKEMDDETNRG